MKNILVVCVGNVCRSPVGERLLQARLPGFDVGSAGIAALSGNAADEAASRIADENGVSLEGHVARQFSDDLGAWADLILVMEGGHKAYLGQHFAQHSGKVMLYDRWAENGDIADPYRKSDEFHKLVFDRLAAAADAWAPKLLRMGTKS